MPQAVFFHGARTWTVTPSLPDRTDTDDRLRPLIARVGFELRDHGPIHYEGVWARTHGARGVGRAEVPVAAAITPGIVIPLLTDLARPTVGRSLRT